MNAYQTNNSDRTERNPRLLASVLLTTTDERIYVVPATKRATTVTLVVCNTGTVSTSFRLHHATPRVTSGASNAHYYDARLANGATIIDEAPRYLEPGDSIRGRAANASIVAVQVYGSESQA